MRTLCETSALFETLPQVMRQCGVDEDIVTHRQGDIARLCGVSPRVLADVEAGKGVQTTETLGKLLRPFGLTLGVVAPPSGSL